jgi:NADPH-dependent 2,4-dienoyl-CoA reductase/sulfur reductase-like enzyme/rhodanese-related sulfurtransferase
MEETIVIIGGLSAGPSAAAKARRVNEKARILMFEKTDYISYATCGIPYSLSGTIKTREKLMVVSPELLRERFNIEVHLNEPVLEVLPEERRIITSRGEYAYTKLIYAAGARPFIPPVEGIEQAANWSNCRTIEDYDKICCDRVLTDRQHIVILGAGLIGVEVSENLNKIGKTVSIVELSPSILPAWDTKFGQLAESVLEERGISVYTNTTISSMTLDGDQIRQVHLSDGTVLPADYLLIGIGGRPNTEMLVSKGAAHLRNGALIVNERMETSLPDIFAAGDCASINNILTGQPDYFPMGTHANKGGRAAGANAAGGDERFRGAYGTAIVKVFDYTLARTGLNTRNLKMLDRPFESTIIIASCSPGFYPDPKDIILEVYYDKESRVLLGAEAFGEKGVDKRIDVLSAALLGGLTVDELPDLDLAYAPPYSPAKDPVVVAGFVSGDKHKYRYRELKADDLQSLIAGGEMRHYQLVDVRNSDELRSEGRIAHALHHDLDRLRQTIGQLDPEKPTIVYCARGLRGYLATMILLHHNFRDVSNLGGGFKAWQKLGYGIERSAVHGA